MHSESTTLRGRNRGKNSRNGTGPRRIDRHRFYRELSEKYVTPWNSHALSRSFYRSETCYLDDAIGQRNGRGARY